MKLNFARILAAGALAGTASMNSLLTPAAKPRIITPEDTRRQQKAQDKRDRRAAKRMKAASNAS